MTTTELIKLLQKLEKGASGRSREISIYTKDESGEEVCIMRESHTLVFGSSGDGCAGAELQLIIE
ncbi:hypothetical protein [Dysgonomonas sp. HGC4]|uniref:hypothetical protein n=1 Tax=Dysgonomonas sp. HGC4 TaxID=1658009 RepID=UPI00067FB756|nr:hypothetical protein [Dysgonomonas sp. HGC4]MBD8348594.1 hypothetical protein [Dysgonomonas sp. HGC4]